MLGHRGYFSKLSRRLSQYRQWAVFAQWLLLLALLTANLMAQDSSAGTFSGTVTDPDGHFVRVPLEVVNVATKVTFRTMASAEGEYSFSQLPAGMYQLTVQVLATSYRTFLRDNVKVASGQTIKLDIHLQEGIGLNTLGDGREFSQDVTHANLVKLVVPAGPTPRMPDGKPDLSGYWSASGGSFDAGIPEFQNWASELARKRQADDLRDLPSARWQPNGIVLAVNAGKAQKDCADHTGLLVMYSEGQLPGRCFRPVAERIRMIRIPPGVDIRLAAGKEIRWWPTQLVSTTNPGSIGTAIRIPIRCMSSSVIVGRTWDTWSSK